ncbi:hypothetical protein QQZ08_007976 [Neonectria magnoliae]|uniref:Uncharacterized protein n=1 Tax=Neonectria magnoliae TaxID=2732573 RepID=A0ABR1HWB8_9HYPO
MISDNSSRFRSQPPHWHASLAEALLSLIQNLQLRKALSELTIIPLSGGEWASASDDPKPVLTSEKVEVNGLSISDAVPTVDPEAAANQARRSLFQALGIRPVEKAQLCQYICEERASPSFKPDEWTKAQLIDHARILHETCWAPADGAIDLWFATSDDKRCKGLNLYMRGNLMRSSPAARVFDRLLERIPTIHPDYVTGTESQVHDRPSLQETRGSQPKGLNTTIASKPYDTDFRSYLTKRLQVSQVPRLVTVDPISKAFQLSEDFKYLLAECPVADTLHVLLGNWRFYSEWLESEVSEKQTPQLASMRKDLVRAIGGTIIKTSQGPLPLRGTFLPNLDTVTEDTILPTLEFVDRQLSEGIKMFELAPSPK